MTHDGTMENMKEYGASVAHIQLNSVEAYQLFDEQFYLAQLSNAGEAGRSPIDHYFTLGWKKGLDPHPLFSTRYYLSQTRLSPQEKIDPLRHYLAIGDQIGILPHPLFDPSYYRQQVQCQNQVTLLHYLTGGHRNVNSHPLFDSAHYRSQVQARRGAIPLNLVPLLDFVTSGNDEGLDPHPLFHTVFYYLHRPDIGSANVTALEHYVRFGCLEGSRPHPLIDFEFYQRNGGDIGSGNPLLTLISRPCNRSSTHPLLDLDYYLRQSEIRGMAESPNHPVLQYLTAGSPAGISPHPLFDVNFYTRNCLSYSPQEGDPLSHFLTYGFREDACPHPMFDTSWYRSHHQRSEHPLMSPLEHYIRNWRDNLDLSPCWGFDSRSYIQARPGCLTHNITPPAHYYSYMTLPLNVPGETVTYAGHEHEKLCNSFAQQPALWRSKSPLRIVVVVHEASRSGAPLIILRLLQHVKENLGAECFTLLQSGGELVEEFARCSRIVDIGKLRRENGITNLTLHISAIARPGRTIALCNSTECAKLGILLSSLGIPTVSLVHEFTSLYPKELVAKLCEASEAVIVPSEAVKSDAISHQGNSCKKIQSAVVLPHGLLLPQVLERDRSECRTAVINELALNPSSFIVLGSGQIQHRKGIDLFVLAAKEFCRKYPAREIIFLWLGAVSSHEPFLEEWILQDIKRAGLDNQVKLIGGRSDPSKYHCAADVFLMMSRLDPFPLVVLEAMGAGTPVITFDEVTGAAEVVKGKGGFVVPFLDINSVVYKLDLLFGNAGLRKEIGQTAKAHISKQHSFEEYVAKILATFRGKFGSRNVEKLLKKECSTLVERGVRGHRIVFTTPDTSLSGVNVAIQKLRRGLLEKGWNVEIVVTRRPHLNDRFVPIGPEHIQLPAFGDDAVLDQLASLQQFLIEGCPSILILGYDHQTNVIASALPADVGVVAVAHCDSPEYYEEIYRLGRYCNKVVCVSEKIQRSIKQLNPGLDRRLEVISCSSVDREQLVANRTYLSADKKLRLVYAGRLVDEQKRILDFIPLTRTFEKLGMPYALTLIGSDNGTGAVEKLRVGLADGIERGTITILDRMTSQEVQRELTRHDVFVLLSDYEGHPLSLIEAMAAGCVPALSPIMSGVPGLIKDGVNGIQFADRDWEKWSARLRLLQCDSTLLRQLGAAATATVERGYLVEHFVERFDRLLLEVEGQLIAQTFERPESLTWHSPFGDLVPPSNWITSR